MSSSLDIASRVIAWFLVLPLCSCAKHAAPIFSLEVASQGIHAAALSEQKQLALIGSVQHGGSLWHHNDKERVFNWNHKAGETTTIIATDFSPESRWALTATSSDLVLWNTESGAGERYWSAPGEILDAKLGPSANLAVLGLSDHKAVIFNIQRGGIVATLPHNNRVRSVDISRDGKLALTGSEDYNAILWDINSGKQLLRQTHQDDVQLVRLSPDGSMALSASKYDRAILWSTRDGEIIGELPLKAEHLKRGLRFTCARFSEDNKYLLTGRPDQMVELWDTGTQEKVAAWELPKRRAWKPSGAAVLDVSFANDGQYYAVASNGFVHHLPQH